MKSIENTVNINYATSLNHLYVSNIIKIIIQINISSYYYHYYILYIYSITYI